MGVEGTGIGLVRTFPIPWAHIPGYVHSQPLKTLAIRPLFIKTLIVLMRALFTKLFLSQILWGVGLVLLGIC